MYLVTKEITVLLNCLLEIKYKICGKEKSMYILKKNNGSRNTQFQVIRIKCNPGLDFIHWGLMGLKTERMGGKYGSSCERTVSEVEQVITP